MEAFINTEIFKIYGISGIFLVMFIFLFTWVLKNWKEIEKRNDGREKVYQDFLQQVSGCIPSLVDTCSRLEKKHDEHHIFVAQSMSRLTEIVQKK